MSDTITEYARLFSPGTRLRVAIPTGEERLFHEWAQILSVSRDLVELQLSRDVLPVGAALEMGTLLELRVGSEGTAYRCRSIIVNTGLEKQLTVRLVGEIILDELREYFRIDVYLPMCLSLPESDDPAKIKEEWQKKRARTVALHQQQHSQAGIWEQAVTGSWNTDTPTAANISGGGIRVAIPEKLKEESLVHIELFLPLHPGIIVNAVAQVITATETMTPAGQLQSTAMRFFHLDERDRDRIIQFITTEQLVQLRHYRNGMRVLDEQGHRRTSSRKAVLTIATISLLAVLLIWFTSWFVSYQRTMPKSEVHRLFEKGLKEYLERLQK